VTRGGWWWLFVCSETGAVAAFSMAGQDVRLLGMLFLEAGSV
jgi:hypothetical protein